MTFHPALSEPNIIYLFVHNLFNTRNAEKNVWLCKCCMSYYEPACCVVLGNLILDAVFNNMIASPHALHAACSHALNSLLYNKSLHNICYIQFNNSC